CSAPVPSVSATVTATVPGSVVVFVVVADAGADTLPTASASVTVVVSVPSTSVETLVTTVAWPVASSATTSESVVRPSGMLQLAVAAGSPAIVTVKVVRPDESTVAGTPIVGAAGTAASLKVVVETGGLGEPWLVSVAVIVSVPSFSVVTSKLI